MEQFLTGDIWEKVNKLFIEYKCKKKFACISYVTLDKLNLSKGDTLICNASESEIQSGKTSAKTLSTYFSKGVRLFSNAGLHSKFLLTDKFLVIGSANLSKNSAKTLTESSIVTNNDTLLSQISAFCYSLKKESKLLKKLDIEELLKISVVKQPFKKIAKSATREKEFGNKYWFTSASLLSDRTYNNIKEIVESTTTSISERENIHEENISFLRFTTKTEFVKTAKEGDQIVLKLNNKTNKQSFVYSPSTILERQVVDNAVLFYYKTQNSEKDNISWTKFQRSIKAAQLDKSITTRTKIISETDINKLRHLWD